MYKDTEWNWEKIYGVWKIATLRFPELRGPLHYRSVNFSKPEYGPCYYFDWLTNGEEQMKIETSLKALASTWSDIPTNWSKGTIQTAALLTCCENEEELAAVWICAFALSLIRTRAIKGETQRNAVNLEHEACLLFVHDYGYWHSNSRDLFPEFYIPMDLFWDDKKFSMEELIEFAAMNAALVLAHYTPVEYKRED